MISLVAKAANFMSTSTQTIPIGYKQTEIGVIPVDWNIVTYDEAFNFLRTAQYSRDQLGKGQVAYVHYGDIHTKWNYFVDLEQSLPTIEDEKVNNYSLVEDGDLIMADASEDYAGIGKSVEVKNVKMRQVISGLHTFLLRDKGSYFVKGFRGYIHASPQVKSSMDRLATGLKVYGISKSNLKLVQIPKPPLPEQSAIATALSDVANLTSGLEELIEKKKLIKQGTMQELLTGKRRLPGFSGECEVKSLGDVVRIRKGQLITDGTRVEGSIPVIAGGKTAAYFHNMANRFGKTITISGSGASAGYVAFHESPIFASDCSTIEDSKNYSVEFVYFFLKLIQEKIYKMQTGGAQPHIHPNDLSPIPILVPQVEEQKAIATVLSDMDTEIEKLESQLTKYQNIKQGMMQVLLTGKIRLI